MLQSSLGFHTMTISLPLSHKDWPQLLMDFVKYREKTESIQVYRKNEDNKYIIYYPGKNFPMQLPIHVKVSFCGKDWGVKWQTRYTAQFSDFSYYLEATINPKLLAGVSDYLTAAAFCDMDMAITKYHLLCSEISPLLGKFDDYRIKRVDYCFNANLDELAPGCDAGLAMNLVKRSDIPAHFEKWTEYDNIAHRNMSRPESFYLTSKSVNINYYSKYMQLHNRSREYEEKGYAPIPAANLDKAKPIIRFEVQCKYFKTYSLSQKAVAAGNDEYNKYKTLFSPSECIEIVSGYYNRTVGKGDWYTLQEATRLVQSKHFNSQKEKRLTDALSEVGKCRSIARAKGAYQGHELEAFKKTLKDLSSLNINPVTIPREWGIKHIPNLLHTYFNKITEGYAKHDPDTYSEHDKYVYYGYSEYLHKYGHAPI